MGEVRGPQGQTALLVPCTRYEGTQLSRSPASRETGATDRIAASLEADGTYTGFASLPPSAVQVSLDAVDLISPLAAPDRAFVNFVRIT